MCLHSQTGLPFVDSVKFAVRGLPALAGCRSPPLAEGSFLSLQQQGAVSRRFRCVWRCAIAWALSTVVNADPGYALLGHEAPDFALHAVAGGNVRLSEHRGDVVILSFWGSRCTPCRAQLAALNRSLSTYRSAGMQVYGINVDDDQTRALGYARSEAVAFALLLDP